MKKTNRKQKGITLIALIITIIVMLILVGVSVSIALNNGLFKATQNAARETEAEKEKEQELATGQIRIDGKTFSSIESYIEGKSGIPVDLKVGDYISNYDPTPVYNNGTNYKVAGSLSGTGTDQTFTEDETLGWRVLSIDETTGKVELIADKATSTKLELKGAIGWNNSINIINDTCKAVYSKAGIGEARSINIEDINKISGYTPKIGSTYKASTSENNNKFPLEYLKEKGIEESTFTDTDIANGYKSNSTISVEDTDYIYKPETQKGYTAPEGLINIETGYWLATRSASVSNMNKVYSMCVKGVGVANWGSDYVGADLLWQTNGDTRDPISALRPVVTLTSNVQLEKDETATTAEKNILENQIKI